LGGGRMIKIQIGLDERTLDEADPSWINQQINKRKADNVFVCVKVIINDGSMNMMLSTPDSEKKATSRRMPTEQEREIFELWDKHKLNEEDFSGGNIVAFLKQLERLI
jgi:hypothetical protein